MTSANQEPLINVNPGLQSYYTTLESRIGYRVLLGGTRHFGCGAEVLDAGCGVGHVAIHMAQKGLRVQGIDVVDHHISKARRNIKALGFEGAVGVRKMDYHHLDGFSNESFEGVYTMETFVHATDPEGVLGEFLRVLKPGGRLALFEYDHVDMKTAPKDLAASMDKVNQYAAMPTNTRLDKDVLEMMLKEAGFEDIVLEDLSVNIRPMLRLFYLIAIIPYLIISFLGLEAWFVNTVAGVEGYRGRNIWRYVAVSARKPIGAKGSVDVGSEGKKAR